MDNITVRIIQDYEGPDLMRQTPGGTGIWDGIRFTYDPIDQCDFLIVLRSQMRTPISVACPRENVWAIVQDPYFPGFNDWLVEGYDQFSRIFTQIPDCRDARFRQSQPALPWYVNRNYDELQVLPPPPKDGQLSWILGNQMEIPGHLNRLKFLDCLKQQGLALDLFGRANRYIADKAEGLLPYRYSLAIENSSCPDYWTEKIADCLLSWTVPIYYGCTNLEDYFPADAFIRIDINRPREALDRIRDTLKNDDWEKRLPAIAEARHLLLDKHQFFPYFSNLIRQQGGGGPKVRVEIPVYRRSLLSRLRRIIYKQKRTYWRLQYKYVRKCL